MRGKGLSSAGLDDMLEANIVLSFCEYVLIYCLLDNTWLMIGSLA